METCPQCGTESEFLAPDDICSGCEIENKENSQRISELIKAGHPEHCAKRQVWGDGECECDLYKQGYDPYRWLDEFIGGE